MNTTTQPDMLDETNAEWLNRISWDNRTGIGANRDSTSKAWWSEKERQKFRSVFTDNAKMGRILGDNRLSPRALEALREAWEYYHNLGETE